MSLVVADIAMPEVDGCELLERARRVRAGLPAVAVSAYARPEDRQRALAAGYNGYCSKPVETAGVSANCPYGPLALTDLLGTRRRGFAEHDSRGRLLRAFRHHPPAQTCSTAEEVNAG